MGGINKFLGLINGEAVCGKGRGREREGSRDAQGSKKDTEVVRDFLMLQKGYDNEVQKQENQKGVSFHHILLFSFGGGHLLIHLS